MLGFGSVWVESLGLPNRYGWVSWVQVWFGLCVNGMVMDKTKQTEEIKENGNKCKNKNGD